MSADSSDDAELSKLQRAAEFMRGIRLTQAGITKKFIGRNRLSPEQQHAITNAISNSALVRAVTASAEADWAVNHMAERFEEMARRQGSYIDVELRPAMVKLLATEFWVNKKALEHKGIHVPSEKLIPVTIHQGAISPELLREFDESLPPSCVAAAITAVPASPREYLRQAINEMEILATDPEFKHLAEKRPSSLYHAVFMRPKDARSKLIEIAERKRNRRQSDSPTM